MLMETPLHAAIAELRSKKFSGLPEAARLSRLFVLEGRLSQVHRLERFLRIAQAAFAIVIAFLLVLSCWGIPRLQPEKILSGDVAWLLVYLLSPLVILAGILSIKMRRAHLLNLKSEEA